MITREQMQAEHVAQLRRDAAVLRRDIDTAIKRGETRWAAELQPELTFILRAIKREASR